MATKKKTTKKATKTATKKKAPAKKAAAKKKAPAKKAAAKKKAPAKKAAAKKKAPAKKAAAKKKAPAKKAAAKKTVPAKKAAPVPTKSAPIPPKKKVLIVPKNTKSKQYTQSELYESIKNFCGFTKRSEAREFYDQFTDMVQGSLKSGYKLALPGLGKLQVRKTKARKGINPATREPIQIPAKRKVAFTANKALKDAVL